MTEYSRADRVGGLIRQTLSDILLRSIKDPRIQRATITHVKVTRDLRIARIYFAIGGGTGSIEAATAGFASALGYLRRTLADRLGLRYMPEIEFFYDESFDYGSHIEQLLKSIEKKQ